MRRERNFAMRSPRERQWLEQHTWCDRCDQADLGLRDPVEYEEDGVLFVEGNCRVCGETVVSNVDDLPR